MNIVSISSERNSADREFPKYSFFLAKWSIILYFFFVVFGTSLPFGERISDVEDITTSNFVNQVVYSMLFLTSLLALIGKKREVIELIKKEKFYFLFLIWCLFSILWSDFSFVSFKRLFQVITSSAVIMAGVFYANSIEEIIKYLKYILLGFVLLSFLSIISVSGAIDPNSFAWRGLAPHKNSLGQISLITIILWFNAFWFGKGKMRIFAFLITLLSLVLILGSKSITAIITLILLTSIWFIFTIDNRLRSLNIGRLFSILVFFTMLGLFSLGLYMGPDIMSEIPKYFGKDITFTGRVDLWQEIFQEARNHLFIGSGFGGFWVVENPNLLRLYEEFIWLPRQAHMGYLDILNETGIIGIFIFTLMTFRYFVDLFNNRKFNILSYVLIGVLIINFQESTLFRQNVFTGVLFNLAYLGFYIEQIKTDNQMSNYPKR